MTRPPKEARERLLRLLRECQSLDPESGHIDADEALLDYIDDYEITEAFERIRKWYA
jgi:hypothetical protein